MLEDIAILTGGQMFTEELGIKLENVTVSGFENEEVTCINVKRIERE